MGSYAARDDLGPFGGFTAVGPGGVRLFADFLDTGDPGNPGLPFTLGGGSAGTFEVDVAPAAARGRHRVARSPPGSPR